MQTRKGNYSLFPLGIMYFTTTHHAWAHTVSTGRGISDKRPKVAAKIVVWIVSEEDPQSSILAAELLKKKQKNKSQWHAYVL